MKYLITKHFEPTGDYAASLNTLSGEEEDRTPDLPVIVKSREMTEEEAKEVEGRSHILSVELDKDMSVPTPPDVSEKSNTVNPAQARAFHNIDKVQGDGVKGKGQAIFVLDTGLTPWAADHLSSRVVYKGSFVSGEPGWESSNNVHGTWCLGTIADIATEAKLGAIKVLSDSNGSGQTSGIVSGINEAVKQGATVISMSLGGGTQTALDQAVAGARSRGVSVAVAAGNEQRGKTTYTADNTSPAEERSVLTVAAVDSGSTVADFSNWGNSVDLAAMGVNVLSDYVPGAWSGTSMATPHVAGGIGLVRSKNDNADTAEKALVTSSRNTSAPVYQEGAGIMDVQAAVAKLSPAPTPAPSPSPKTINLTATCHMKLVDKEYQVTRMNKPWGTIAPPKK